MDSGSICPLNETEIKIEMEEMEKRKSPQHKIGIYSIDPFSVDADVMKAMHRRLSTSSLSIGQIQEQAEETIAEYRKLSAPQKKESGNMKVDTLSVSAVTKIPSKAEEDYDLLLIDRGKKLEDLEKPLIKHDLSNEAAMFSGSAKTYKRRVNPAKVMFKCCCCPCIAIYFVMPSLPILLR